MKRLLPIALVVCCAPAWAQKSVLVRVLDAQGQPIQGAHVLLDVRSEGEAPLAPKITDASGKALFSIPGIAPADSPTMRIIAGAKGYAFNATLLIQGEGKPEVRLDRGQTWRGKVVDEAGKPIAGVQITVRGAIRNRDHARAISLPEVPSPLSALYATKSNADGTFTIENLPDDKDLQFRAVSAGFALAQGETRAGTTDQITLMRGGSVRGRVLAPDGKPLTNVAVFASADMGLVGNKAATNAQGVFTIANLAPGVYSVGTQPRWDAPYILSDRSSVRIEADKTLQLSPWRAKSGVFIRGIVRDALTKKPLAKTNVFAESQSRGGARVFASSDSDASGRFTLRVLPGTYSVSAIEAPSGYLSSSAERQVNVDASGKQSGPELSFGLKRAPIIRGVIRDEAGQPIVARLGANLGRTIKSDAKGRWQLTPDRTGNLIFSGLKDDTGYFEVVAPKKVDWPVMGQVSVVVRHIPWATVTGRVVTPEGAPIEGVIVRGEYLVGPKGGPWTGIQSTAVTDKDGRYTFTQMQGTQGLKVSAKKQGVEFQSGGIVSRQGEAVSNISDLVMVTLSGGIEGVTQPGALVVVEGRELRADSSGHFAVAQLPPGPHAVFVAKDSAFGSATGNTAFNIALSPLAPQAQDKPLAQELWDKLKKAGKAPTTLQDWQTPPSFENNMKAAQTAGDIERIAEVAASWKKGDSLDALLSGLQSIKPTDQRADSFLKAALATRNPDLMERALEETATLFQQPTTNILWREPQLYMAAVLRERVNGADDGRLALNTALAYTLQNHGEETRIENATIEQVGRNQALSEVAAIVAQGSPALLQGVLDAIDDGTGFKTHALSQAVPVVVKTHGLEAAQPLLARLKKALPPKVNSEPNYVSFNPQWSYGQAVIDIIPLIGAKFPAKALELAKGVESGDQGTEQVGRALASAAKYQAPEVAAPLYREAVQKLSTESAPFIAATVWARDPKLGLELFSLARQKAADEMKSRFHYRNAWVPFAFYFSRANPAQSRLILEREWGRARQAKSDLDDAALIAIAMTRIDAKRALEMVSQMRQNSGWDDDARLKIARYLFADETTRQGFVLSQLGNPLSWGAEGVQW